MPSIQHPSREDLAAYAHGELSETIEEVVADHVEQCARCEETVTRFEREAGTILGQLRKPVVHDPCLDEPECQRVLELVRRMGPQGAEPAPTTGVAAAPASVELGQLREYRLLEKLGEGGMGAVYKALHTKLDKLVALKLLPAAAIGDAERVARFEREMRAVGKLEHPHIVRAMDAGCHEGTHFLVMEYVDGVDLGKIVPCCGRLRIADACEVIRQAALGLRYADEHALVHRDIKPSNLMLSPEGEVKILDLGLALLQGDRMPGEEATGQGRAMGTVDYMAPEQVRDSHNVDIRADIYSLGCTLYKLLTGHAPYSGPEYESHFDKLMAHVSQPFPAIREARPDVPERLAAVLERMVVKDRDARYAKPGQVVEELKPFCPGCDLVGLLAHARKTAQTAQATPAILAATDPLRADVPILPAAGESRPEPPDQQPVRFTPATAPEPSVPGAAGRTRPTRPRGLVKEGLRRVPPHVWVAGGCITVMVFFGVMISVRTNYGEAKIEILDPTVNVEVKLDGNTIDIAGLEEPLRLKVGEHDLEVTSPGFQTFSTSFTAKRGGAEVIRVRLRPKEPTASVRKEPAQVPSTEPPPLPTPFRRAAKLGKQGWPHEGQNLWHTNCLAAASLPLRRKLALKTLWGKPHAITVRTADLDGDGNLEVIYLESTGRARPLVVLDGDGTERWRRDPVADSGVVHSGVQTWQYYDLADVDGDGDCEIILNVNCDTGWTKDRPNRILIYDGDGTLLRNFPVQNGAWAYPVVADVTGDGQPEIVVGLADFRGQHGAYVYRLDGTLLGRTLAGEGFLVGAIADLDKDGVNEALLRNFASHNRQPSVNGVDDFHAYVIAIKGDGRLFWLRQLGTCSSSVAVTELSRDGKPKVIAFRQQDPVNYPGPNEVHILDGSTGKTLLSYVGPPNACWGNWVVADVNGDQQQEIVLGDVDGSVHMLDANLKLIGQKKWSGRVDVLAGNDLDGDGAVEVVVGVGTNVHILDGKLDTKCTFDIGTKVHGAIISDVNSDGINEILVETEAGLRVLGFVPAAPQLPANLQSADLVVHVATGATVDIRAIAADRVNFPNAVIEGDRVVFEVPRPWFNYDRYTRSGGWRIPDRLQILMSISQDGMFDCGVFGHSPGDVLAMFVDSVADVGPKPAFSFENALDVTFQPVKLDRSERLAHPYTRMDARQNGLACAIAKTYWICAVRKYLHAGQANTFGQLYDLTWWLRNASGFPITVLKACLYSDSLPDSDAFRGYVRRLWCPLPPGTVGRDADTARILTLDYREAKATAFIAQAVNDNGLAAQVWLDDRVLIDEGGRGASTGGRIVLNAFPKTVKLVLNRSQGPSCASVVVAQLGGTLKVADFHAYVNGVDNPPTPYHANAPAIVLRIPEGWFCPAAQDGQLHVKPRKTLSPAGRK